MDHLEPSPAGPGQPGPATMSRRNFHHVVAALAAYVPAPGLEQALADYRLDRPEARVDQHRCVELVGLLARRQGDPSLLLRGFRHLDGDQKLFPGLPGFPGDALTGAQQFLRYLPLHTELVEMTLEIGADASELRLQRRAAFEDSHGQAQALLFSSRRLLQRSGLKQVRAVHLQLRPSASERARLAQLYDVPVHFGMPCDALLLDNNGLLHQNPASLSHLSALGARERLLRRIRPHITVSESVRGLLPIVLGLPGTPLGLCASLLALSERTLQRRVEAEGGSFRGLLQESRRELALTLMPWRALSAEQLAARLGYRQSAQFYRAFRAWFGESPGSRRALAPA